MSDFMIRNFYKQRKDFEKSSAERNLTLTFPDTVTEIKNIPYMTDGSAAKDNTSLDTDFPLQSSKSHICDSHRLFTARTAAVYRFRKTSFRYCFLK